MNRKRMIHPSFFTSKPLSDMPIPCMVTFAGIWCWADDYGRGEDDPVLVRAAVWPRRKAVTEKHVAAHMDQLVAAGMLCRYVVGGYPLIHVVSWREHQSVSHPSLPKVPPCPTHEAVAFEEFLSASDTAREHFRNPSGDLPETFQHSVVKRSSVQFRSSKTNLPTSPSAGAARLGLEAI